MAQIFSRSADTWLRLGLLAVLMAALGGILMIVVWDRSDYRTGRLWPVEQPLPFSHAHHVGELKIDCLYCHTGAPRSALAGLPASQTCMTCHSHIWKRSDVLEPLRRSLREHVALRWNRVVKLPDYTFFHHGVHLNAGVGCDECHGPVERMQLLAKSSPLDMRECLACHRDPAPRLRPSEHLTQLHWPAPSSRRALGEQLMKDRGISPTGLTDCGVCHR